MIRWMLISLLFILSIIPAHAYAQDPSLSPSDDVLPLPTVTTTITPATVNYTLPYPGILPNNPLYWVKTLRDNVIGWLISNPAKKSTFDILQADKRLESGVFLLNQSKTNAPLALTTISKGENYMTDAIAKAQQARSEGMLTSELIGHLQMAAKKHQEVLQQMVVPSDQKKELQSLQSRVKELVKQANSLQIKK